MQHSVTHTPYRKFCYFENSLTTFTPQLLFHPIYLILPYSLCTMREHLAQELKKQQTEYWVMLSIYFRKH